MTRRLRVARHRHFLGSWDPAERVRIGQGVEDVSRTVDWQAPAEGEIGELGALEPLEETALCALAAVPPTQGAEPDLAVVAAMTVPARVRRELWELGWDDEAATLTPRDQQAFAAYGRRLVAFFRAAGVALGGPDRPCQTRLHALAPGTSPIADDGTASLLALVNVGESECYVATMAPAGVVALRVPPDEGCLLSRAARPCHIVVPPDAEFGLLLELA